jgi:hypothetical protein
MSSSGKTGADAAFDDDDDDDDVDTTGIASSTASCFRFDLNPASASASASTLVAAEDLSTSFPSFLAGVESTSTMKSLGKHHFRS